MTVQQILVNKVQRWINAEGRYLNKGVEKETYDVEMKKCTGLIILVEVYISVLQMYQHSGEWFHRGDCARVGPGMCVWTLYHCLNLLWTKNSKKKYFKKTKFAFAILNSY